MTFGWQWKIESIKKITHLHNSQSIESLPCSRQAHGVEGDGLRLCGAYRKIIETEVEIRVLDKKGSYPGTHPGVTSSSASLVW